MFAKSIVDAEEYGVHSSFGEGRVWGLCAVVGAHRAATIFAVRGDYKFPVNGYRLPFKSIDVKRHGIIDVSKRPWGAFRNVDRSQNEAPKPVYGQAYVNQVLGRMLGR